MAAPGRTVVQVEGLRDLQRRIRRVDRELLVGFKDEHRWIADYVKTHADPHVPRRSGALERSGRASGTQRTSTIRYGGARVPYAGPIHYGWPQRHIQPQEWVLNAAHSTQPVWVGHYNETLRRLIEETPQ